MIYYLFLLAMTFIADNYNNKFKTYTYIYIWWKNDLLQFLYIINHDLIIQWYGEHLDN